MFLLVNLPILVKKAAKRTDLIRCSRLALLVGLKRSVYRDTGNLELDASAENYFLLVNYLFELVFPSFGADGLIFPSFVSGVGLVTEVFPGPAVDGFLPS